MGTPYLSEIRIVSFNFAAKGWALCNGQLMPINQNTALFSLLGTTYGGNGVNTFALPNLQGRTPMHTGATQVLGQAGGAAAVTLLQTEMPQHTHGLVASADFANASAPGGAVPAARPRGGKTHYTAAGNANTTMGTSALALSGASQPHDNLQPYAVLNFMIALTGIFPSRN